MVKGQLVVITLTSRLADLLPKAAGRHHPKEPLDTPLNLLLPA